MIAHQTADGTFAGMTNKTAMSVSLFAHGRPNELARFHDVLGGWAADEHQPLLPLLSAALNDHEEFSVGDRWWVEWAVTSDLEQATTSRHWLDAWETVGLDVESLAEMFPKLTLIGSVGCGGPDSFAASAIGDDGEYQGWTTTSAVDSMPCVALISSDGCVLAMSSGGPWDSHENVGSGLVVAANGLFASGVEEILVCCPSGPDRMLLGALLALGWSVFEIAEPADTSAVAAMKYFSVHSLSGD